MNDAPWAVNFLALTEESQGKTSGWEGERHLESVRGLVAVENQRSGYPLRRAFCLPKS
jgi:hypothetical protein